MKVETQSVAPCRVKLVVTTEAEETRADYKHVIGMYMKNGRVPGFRQGKVPRDMILRAFGKDIHEQTVRRLLDAMVPKAIKEADLKVVQVLNCEKLEFDPEKGINFDLVVDVRPEFKLPKYKGIPVTFEEPAVTDEQVKDQVNKMRTAFAKFEDAKEDYLIADSDLVSINFEATSEGKPLVEIDENAKAISSAKDFWIQIEEDRFIPEVVNGLKGLRQGEKTEIKFTFDDKLPIEGLRNKPVVFQVEVTKVRQRILPKDEDLLTQLHIETMDKFLEDTRKELEAQAAKAEKERRQEMVTNYLLEKAGEFDLPESELAEQVNGMTRAMMDNAMEQGATRENLEKNRAQILESATVRAKAQLRLAYIMGSIIREEKIQLKDEDVQKALQERADEYRVSVDLVREAFEKRGSMEALKESAMVSKLMDFLLAEAKQA